MKIIADEHIPYVRDYFASVGELVLKPGRAITAADMRDADMLLVRSVTMVDEALLADSPVKFVGSVTSGVDHVDITFLERAGISFAAASGFNAPPVADYVVSVLATLQRKHLFPQHVTRAAVVGVGRVGAMVQKRLSLLGIETVLCDPLRAEQESDFSHVALDDIEHVDLISLHVPLTRHGSHPTWHMIDTAFLQRQKKGCVLLNASRGAVVSTPDLLQSGAHLHWCLDVFEHEPEINKAVLENTVIATPHIAGYSVQASMRGTQMIFEKACEQRIISGSKPTLTLPRQALSFAGREHHWQDIVMGVFNPLVMTALMRAVLLPEKCTAMQFDKMRRQFNYRHEFAYTTIESDDMLIEDKRVLEGLGLTVSAPKS